MCKLAALLCISLSLFCCNTKSADNPVNDTCKCLNDDNPVLSFTDKNNNHLIFCGYLNEKISENTFLLSEYELIDCNGNSVLIDHTQDAIFADIVTLKADSVLISNTHFILDSNWDMDIVPVSEITVRFVQNKPILSSERNVFIIPSLTNQQQDSLLRLNNNLKQKAKTGKDLYPYDEKSIYLLFMGAINGNADAKYLLDNLDSLFILDGAIAETKGEIWVKY